MLFARYAHGGHFSPHTDGYSIVDFNYRSMCVARHALPPFYRTYPCIAPFYRTPVSYPF